MERKKTTAIVNNITESHMRDSIEGFKRIINMIEARVEHTDTQTFEPLQIAF